MGRGRAKAKQTAVARKLKYSSPETDYEKLQRELAADGHTTPSPVTSRDDEDDPYAEDLEQRG